MYRGGSQIFGGHVAGSQDALIDLLVAKERRHTGLMRRGGTGPLLDVVSTRDRCGGELSVDPTNLIDHELRGLIGHAVPDVDARLDYLTGQWVGVARTVAPGRGRLGTRNDVDLVV